MTDEYKSIKLLYKIIVGTFKTVTFRYILTHYSYNGEK